MFKYLATILAFFSILGFATQSYAENSSSLVSKYRGRAIQYNSSFGTVNKSPFPKASNIRTKQKQILNEFVKEHELKDEVAEFDDDEEDKDKDSPQTYLEKITIPESPLELSYKKLYSTEALEELPEEYIDLQQKGYDLFLQEHSFLLQNQRSFNDSFNLIQGDSLYIATSGTIDMEFEVIIDHKHQIFLPKIGVIELLDLSYQDAEKKIRQSIQNYYKGSKVYIRVNSSVERSVYVIGKVKSPGLVIIPPNTTLIDALLASGGISKNGSLRHIEIRKNGKTTSVDLYDLLLTGKWDPVSLTGREVIFVPAIKKTIAVTGEVLEPGIYEIKNNDNLEDIIQFSQGLTPAGHQHTINIFRPSALNNGVDVLSYRQETLKTAKLNNHDIVQVLPRRHLIGNSIRIFGAVNYPGTYEVEKNETLKTALNKAGGSLYGDIVLLHRRLKDIQSIDLPQQKKGDLHYETKEYRLLTDILENIKVMPGDTITIPNTNPITTKPKVTITGEINKPGEYFFSKNLNLYHLLSLASGITEEANLQGLSIGRINGDKIDRILLPKDIDTLSSLQSIILKPGDVITVPTSPKNTIMVIANGEFFKPGQYILPKGARLSDLIHAAGGFKTTAYAAGAGFYRNSVAQQYEQQLQKMAKRLEQDLLRSQAATAQRSIGNQDEKNALIFARQERLINHLESAESPGRVIIKLDNRWKKLVGTSNNIVLEDGDRLDIPGEPSTVNIIGQVNNPNTIVYSSGLFLKDYLDAGGGLTKYADEKNIFIIRANGAVIPAEKITYLKKGWLSGRSQANFRYKIEPGDTVLIPEDFEIRFNKLQTTKDITQIMFQIITSVGVAVAAF